MSVRLAIVAATVLWPVFGTFEANAQEFVSTAPEARAFKLGAIDVAALRDTALAIPNDGSIFGVNASPDAVAKVLSGAGAPTDKVRLDVNALLVRMPGHLVLIDLGFGSLGHGVLRESLALAGAAPKDVTDILITHAHPDHVSGLLDPQGRLAFPNAAIRMSAKEWVFMQAQSDTKQLAATIHPRVKTFDSGQSILPGITPIALYGHTPGHVGYEIASQGKTLLDMGDIAHSSIVSLQKPDWTMGFDVDKAAGATKRREELQRLASAHQLIFAPHFPFPGIGRIEQAGQGFAFRPELPAPARPKGGNSS
jgi:glyoxylase-like metal-dependent hydrolase (beta-lactamase superfamily II)